jgi:hypothetical protein
MTVLKPTGPFLLIQWDPDLHRCDVKGTIADRKLALEMLDRAKATLKEHYEEQRQQNLVERPRIHLPA